MANQQPYPFDFSFERSFGRLEPNAVKKIQVIQGSPADTAGIKPGDVITSFGGKEITTAEDMIRAIHISEIGQKTAVTYWRGNVEYDTEIIPAESPPR